MARLVVNPRLIMKLTSPRTQRLQGVVIRTRNRLINNAVSDGLGSLSNRAAATIVYAALSMPRSLCRVAFALISGYPSEFRQQPGNAHTGNGYPDEH